MAGRRLRESVKEVILELPNAHNSTWKMIDIHSDMIIFLSQVLIDHGFPSDTVVVIAGLSNSYSQYVTTFEEYQVM